MASSVGGIGQQLNALSAPDSIVNIVPRLTKLTQFNNSLVTQDFESSSILSAARTTAGKLDDEFVLITFMEKSVLLLFVETDALVSGALTFGLTIVLLSTQVWLKTRAVASFGREVSRRAESALDQNQSQHKANITAQNALATKRLDLACSGDIKVPLSVARWKWAITTVLRVQRFLRSQSLFGSANRAPLEEAKSAGLLHSAGEIGREEKVRSPIFTHVRS